MSWQWRKKNPSKKQRTDFSWGMNIDGIRRAQKNAAPALFNANGPAIATSRRSFLKYVMLGSGVLVIGKILGPSLSLFPGAEKKGAPLSFKNFHMVEKDKEMRIFDNNGDEILTFDKTA